MILALFLLIVFIMMVASDIFCSTNKMSSEEMSFESCTSESDESYDPVKDASVSSEMDIEEEPTTVVADELFETLKDIAKENGFRLPLSKRALFREELVYLCGQYLK